MDIIVINCTVPNKKIAKEPDFSESEKIVKTIPIAAITATNRINLPFRDLIETRNIKKHLT